MLLVNDPDNEAGLLGILDHVVVVAASESATVPQPLDLRFGVTLVTAGQLGLKTLAGCDVRETCGDLGSTLLLPLC